MDYLFFNSNFGYLEGLVRGLKSFMLTKHDYDNMVLCETLDDIKLNLMTGDYINYVSNIPSPVMVSMLEEKLKEKLVKEFFYFRNNSVEPLSTFLDYIRYNYMIDNICLLISGMVHQRPPSELLPRCHPLGIFDQISTISIVSTPSQLYQDILVDTPLGTSFLGIKAKFFESCDSQEQFDEMHSFLTVKPQVYLESFYELCKSIGGITFEVMEPIIQFESDHRCFSISINSIG
ncbi:hypothetical protein HZS_6397, partial [Henneguya salminicola]